jgi:hypothetical protein
VGFETRILRVEFVERPAVEVHDPGGRSPGRRKVVFEPIEHSILAPVILELDVARAPSRTELHALCDGCRGALEIQEALRGLGA